MRTSVDVVYERACYIMYGYRRRRFFVFFSRTAKHDIKCDLRQYDKMRHLEGTRNVIAVAVKYSRIVQAAYLGSEVSPNAPLSLLATTPLTRKTLA